MAIKIRVLFLSIISFFALLPAFAHHGFQAEYDGSKVVYVTGVLMKVEWANPHLYVYVDAKDDEGKVTSWTFEGASPILVDRTGTHRSDLIANIGKTVTVRATPAKSAAARGAGETMKVADGRELVIGGKRYSGDSER